MYNKKVLIDSLKNLGSAKAPVKRQDVLVDPSGNPLMSNGGLNEKPYKKLVYKNLIYKVKVCLLMNQSELVR